ncbi:MAG: sigma-70 family RNA polymerase sigma factor [Actinomycetota bacterium]|nr:sigma-70 family RNA polymerase sigma factor [Actinomycetota bacterium]
MPDDGDSTTERAITRAKEGDSGALHFLYIRYANDVYRCARNIVQNHHEAEDITQNVFAKLMQAIAKYEARQVPFSAWIMRVARNAALDHLRARRLVPCEDVRTDDEGQQAEDLERAQCLRVALEELPPGQREVLVLRHIAGLAPSEIAERLDKTEGSIHGLHHRGRGALQTALRELESGPVTLSA